MHDERDAPPPVDLSPLDPFDSTDRANALVAAIVRDGMAARKAPRSFMVVRQVERLTTPALLAAGLVLAVSLPALLTPRGNRTAAASLPAATAADTAVSARRFGLPDSVIALTRPDRSPTPAEIVAAFTVHQAKQ